MPPVAKGPRWHALAFTSANFFCSSFNFSLNLISSSSSSLEPFLGFFKGFFLPPSREDIFNFNFKKPFTELNAHKIRKLNINKNGKHVNR
ncbi:hypothetical protein PGB90_005840 [Kerria lacca]